MFLLRKKIPNIIIGMEQVKINFLLFILAVSAEAVKNSPRLVNDKIVLVKYVFFHALDFLALYVNKLSAIYALAMKAVWVAGRAVLAGELVAGAFAVFQIVFLNQALGHQAVKLPVNGCHSHRLFFL